MNYLRTHPDVAGLLLAFAAVVALLWYLNTPPGPLPLPKKQQRHLAERRDSANRAAAADTARAHRATASARASVAAGRRAETNAATLHAQTHVLHRPLPAAAASSAAVADSLTRLLSVY